MFEPPTRKFLPMNLPEPASTAKALLAIGALLGTGVLLSRLLHRTGVFTGLLFLAVGILAGNQGPGAIAFDDYQLTFQIGTASLVLILFDGGLNTRMDVVRRAIAPAAVMATAGVLITAGLTALACRLAGLSWWTAFVLGAVVSSTDAAAVFSVLRSSGLRVRERLGALLELESGLNDPIAFILTVSLTEAMLARRLPGYQLLIHGVLQLVLGMAWGIAFGALGRLVFKYLRLHVAGLYPLIAVAMAFVSYGMPTITFGSGLVSVYVAAVIIGNGTIRYRAGLLHVQDSLAWFAQSAMFLVLGLLVDPSRLLPAASAGVGIALVLAFIARPAATLLCLLPFRFSLREIGYIGWVGMRGAVPIIFATYPVLVGANMGRSIFDIVFFVVLVNAIVPGITVRFATNHLGVMANTPPEPPLALDITTTRLFKEEILTFFIDPRLVVCDARIADIPFPNHAAVSLIIREDELIVPKGDISLRAGDYIFVLCKPGDRRLLMLLFGSPDRQP